VKRSAALFLTIVAFGVAAGTAFAAPLGLGDRTSSPANTAAPIWMVVGSANTVWFSDDGGARVRAMGLDGTLTHESPALGSRTFGIAATGDGRIWFANHQTSGDIGVGRVDADGANATWFDTSDTGNPALQDLVLGPDGNIWFTEWDGTSVGKVTPTGTVTRYPSGSPGGNTYSIAVGDDGNLWYVFHNNPSGGAAYARVTPSGVVSTWNSNLTKLAGIAADGLGYMWMVDEATDKILKVSTGTGTATGTAAGTVVAEFTTPRNGPRQIALGPDGGMWFTMFEGASIGRLDRTAATGTTATWWYAKPDNTTAFKPFDIVWGPDGAMWYTNLTGGTIGRIGTGLDTPPTTVPGGGGGGGGGTTPPADDSSGSGGGSAVSPAPSCIAPPAGPVGVSINGGATYTNSRNVVLDVIWPTCTATVSVANDGGFRAVETRSVAAEIPWVLSTSGPERLPKTVYLRFGSSTQNYTDDIILDQAAPEIVSVTVTVTVGTGRAGVAERRAAAGRVVSVAVRARDRGGSGPATVQVRAGRSQAVGAYGRRVSVATARDSIRVRVKDRAGNWSPFRTVRVG